jgi:hypothetical protein
MVIAISFVIFFVLFFCIIWFLLRKRGEDSGTSLKWRVKNPWLAGAISSALEGTGAQTRIVFNGKEYASPHEMPADVRQAYDQIMGDANRDGIPDVFQGEGLSQIRHTGIMTTALQDSTERLRKLKEARDSGLITEQEYEAKKAEILNKM